MVLELAGAGSGSVGYANFLFSFLLFSFTFTFSFIIYLSEYKFIIIFSIKKKLKFSWSNECNPSIENLRSNYVTKPEGRDTVSKKDRIGTTSQHN